MGETYRWKIEYQHVMITDTKVRQFNCNEVTFVNKGSTTAVITLGAEYEVFPGESITYPGKPGEMNQTSYYINFPAVSNGNKLLAIVKTYLTDVQ